MGLPTGTKGDGKLIFAPWSEPIASALNAFQASGVMHPFTCGGEHTVPPVLTATGSGWICPNEACGYTQSWAHSFMGNRRLWENRGLAGMLARRQCTDMMPCGEAKCRACYWRKEALEKGAKLREESELRQKLYKGLRLLKSTDTVHVRDVATWIQQLLTGGPGTHLQDLYGSGHEEPMRAVWTGQVDLHHGLMVLTVLMRGEEVPVDITEEQEAELIAKVAGAHAGWSPEDAT